MHRVVIPIVLIASFLFLAKNRHKVHNVLKDTGVSSLLTRPQTSLFSAVSANERFKRYDVSTGLLFAPRFDEKTGYKNTFPRMDPSVSSELEDWEKMTAKDAATTKAIRSETVRLGWELVNHLNNKHSYDKGFIPALSQSQRRMFLAQLPHGGQFDVTAQGNSCMSYDTRDVASAVLGGEQVESRLWACFVVITSLNITDSNFVAKIGAERAWLSTEYRFFLRELQRREMIMSGGSCHRNFGASARFLGHGAWGMTYSRCFDKDPHRCQVMPRSIIKLTALPKWTHCRTPPMQTSGMGTTTTDEAMQSALLAATPDGISTIPAYSALDGPSEEMYEWAGLPNRVRLSNASLAAGCDASLESYLNEAARVLVGAGVTPHMTIGYGSWMCDDFFNGSAPANIGNKNPLFDFGVKCSEAKKKAKKPNVSAYWDEMATACNLILSYVEKGHSSEHLQLMSMEEVLVSLPEAIEGIYNEFKQHKNKLRWREEQRSLLFQIAYNLASVQKHFPTFRHNDLSWYNIRSTTPTSVTTKIKDHFKQETKEPIININGAVYAPLRHGDGLAATYTDYTFDNATYHLPNYGYNARMADWDFAGGRVLPRMWNEKISERYHKRCAWPLKTLWFDNANTATNAGNVHRKQGNILEVQIPDANAFASVKDNAKFVDSNKLTCADWREDCPSFDFYFSFYTRPDTLRIWKNCPKACNAQQGTVRMTVEAPPFEQHVDARLCDRWKQDCHHAADKAFSNGKLRSIEDQEQLIRDCPVACGAHPNLQSTASTLGASTVPQQYLINVSGNAIVPDGVYRATRMLSAQASYPGAWVMEFSVANLRLNKSAKVGVHPVIDLGDVVFLQQPWFEVYSVTTMDDSDDGNFQYEIILQPHASPMNTSVMPDIAKNDIIMLGDNDAFFPDQFRVNAKWAQHGITRAMCPTCPLESMLKIRAAAMRFRADRDKFRGVKKGGFGFVTSVFLTTQPEDFYQFSHIGIAPVENEKFDLHFILNHLHKKTYTEPYEEWFHPEIKTFIQGIFEDSDKWLGVTDGPYSSSYRLGNAFHHWWCDRPGTWETDESTTKDFPTPARLLRHSFFSDLKESPIRSMRIGGYNASATLPRDLRVGTGAL
eukprot:m.543855 g.543855  ORF g.543855 m.543855 type:complete len:1112 (+) comp22132_c0_seq8:263-3598(+)